MAAFLHPIDAVQAMLAAQRALASRSPGREPVSLKAGVHYGPCIAVTLNDRLDCFGSSVNIAARLEGLSRGGDVIVSGAVYQDPDVEHFLADAEGLVVERAQGTLKGLEEEEIAIWRIRTGVSQHGDRGSGMSTVAEEAPSP